MLSKNLLSWIYRESYEWNHKQFFGTVESYTPEVEDHSFSSPYQFADVHLKSNAHDQAKSRLFLKRLFIFTRVSRKYETLTKDGFFKRKQENNFPITQTQCVMDDYNSLEQSIWSQNLNNKSP